MVETETLILKTYAMGISCQVRECPNERRWRVLAPGFAHPVMACNDHVGAVVEQLTPEGETLEVGLLGEAYLRATRAGR